MVFYKTDKFHEKTADFLITQQVEEGKEIFELFKN